MYSVREALRAFGRAPVLTGLSSMLIALSLFVVGLFGLVAYNVREVIRGVEQRVEVVAYLRDNATRDEVTNAIAQVSDFPEVREVRYISRDSALAIARRELTELENVFGSLETNPLPASLEVSLHTGRTDLDAVRAVAERIRLYAFVEDVSYGEDWVDKVYVLRRVAAAATLVLGLGFAAVGSLIIGAAIRMSVFARRDEIIIMRLVGATDAFVRRPFVLEGLLTGAAGALLALVATWALYRLLSGSVFDLEWLPPAWLGAGFAAGALVGVVASTIAVRRHLREIA